MICSRRLLVKVAALFLISTERRMLKLFNTRSLEQTIQDNYALLRRDACTCSVQVFEMRMRHIHILCNKILRRSADLGKTADTYDL